MSRGEILRRIPLRQRLRWSPGISLLVDFNARAQPFWDDFNDVLQKLERLHGAAGLAVSILDGEPGRQLRVRRPGSDTVRRWPVPDPRTPLLILSDLGLLDPAREAVSGWRQLGYRLRAVGCAPVVLCPVPDEHQDITVQHLYDVREWDRHSRFRRCKSASPDKGMADSRGAEALLTLLAPAIVIEPALLRAARYLLPVDRADVAAEALVWQHSDTQSSTQACWFGSLAAIDQYQRGFPALDRPLQLRVLDLVRAHHARLPASVRFAELEVFDRLLPGALDEAIREEMLDWKRGIVKRAVFHLQSAGLRQWRERHLARSGDAVKTDNPELDALWALSQRERLEAGLPLELPAHVDPEAVRFFLQRESVEPRRCRLLQRGQALVLAAGDSAEDALNSPYGELVLPEDGLFVQPELGEQELPGPVHYIPVAELPRPLLELTRDTHGVILRTTSETLVIDGITKRAPAMGRDQKGLFAEALWLGTRYRVDWKPPSGGTWADHNTWDAWSSWSGSPGFWQADGPVGYDEFGLYADLAFRDVTQRFRWIDPGTFVMGSPESELERSDDETLHEVTLTQGYWLADSACTQALWQVVMGGNPSRFSDDPNNPVENASWDDVQGFLAALNAAVPGLNARLPTEAEWEYACRAGTDTPFSFGATVTPEQVNYNGDYPYAGGEKALFRRRTLPVKSLPPNDWGLYEMHGNVWEWCSDWFGTYPAEAVSDPTGPPEGAARVLRGGSWHGLARLARSAYRYYDEPDDRLGFRLALGQPAAGRPGERTRPHARRGSTGHDERVARLSLRCWSTAASIRIPCSRSVGSAAQPDDRAAPLIGGHAPCRTYPACPARRRCAS